MLIHGCAKKSDAFIFPIENISTCEKHNDLDILKNEIVGVKIVGLGESTHGSKEVFIVKHRIVKYLVEEIGYTVYTIEASMADAEKINQYIFGGDDNAKELLTGLGFWTWNTTEMLELVEWMRQYNFKTNTKIQFRGFDFLIPFQTIKNITVHVDSNAFLNGRISQLSGLYKSMKDYYAKGIYTFPQSYNDSLYQVSKEIRTIMNDRYSEIKDKNTKWLKQNAELLFQYSTLSFKETDEGYRDSCMAVNFNWIVKNSSPEDKLIVWAHNGHIKKTGSAMGTWLYQTYKDKVVVIGFSLYEGKYTAIDNGELVANPLAIPDSSCYEYYLNALPC